METNETCISHPGVAAVVRCERCSRPICRLCAFSVGLRDFCPDCISSGADPEQQQRAANHVRWSVALAAINAGGMVAFLVLAAASENGKEQEAVYGLLGMIILAAALAGLTLGLTGREHGRRTGSPLAIIGIVANALLLTAFLALCVVGSFMS